MNRAKVLKSIIMLCTYKCDNTHSALLIPDTTAISIYLRIIHVPSVTISNDFHCDVAKYYLLTPFPLGADR